MAEPLDALWAAWDAGGRNDLDLARLVTAAQPFVSTVARQVRATSEHPLDDLVSEGNFGLMKAAHRFDPTVGTKFETYAQHKIRSSMRDWMRENDSLSRSGRRRSTMLIDASSRLTQKLRRAPTDQELAGHLGWTEQKVQAARLDVLASHAATQDPQDLLGDSPAAEPGFDYELARQRIGAALDQLRGKERVVMVLYYVEQMSMEDVASTLGVSKALVSKIRDAAAVKVLALLRS